MQDKVWGKRRPQEKCSYGPEPVFSCRVRPKRSLLPPVGPGKLSKSPCSEGTSFFSWRRTEGTMLAPCLGGGVYRTLQQRLPPPPPCCSEDQSGRLL